MMAERKVFMPDTIASANVKAELVPFVYFPGFAISQKQKCIASLHQHIKEKFGEDQKILEVSTKAPTELGKKLSAFILSCQLKNGLSIPAENLFQAGKVFENGGPYQDLLFKRPKDAKRDPRLRNSGKLINFKHKGVLLMLSNNIKKFVLNA